MSKLSSRIGENMKKYFGVVNYRTLISVVISIVATTIAYRFSLIFNLDLTLISVAVVFPLVFTLGSAFKRRERALEHLGRTKGALAAIRYCFSFSNKIVESEKQRINDEVKEVKSKLISFLHSESDDKTELIASVTKIQEFINTHRDNIGRSLSLRVYRLMRDVIMGIENSIAIKVHRTPVSIRAYCELFIYIFPFFYAPTLIKNIQYDGSWLGDMPHPFENKLTLIVYLLNMIISFLLISLFNIQEQIENPFDQDGIDDIMLDNYEMDY